jgi:hypothetical protein
MALKDRLQILFSKTKQASKSSKELTSEQLSHFDKPIITWKAPSFVQYSRTTSWYITVFSVLFLLILAGLLIGSATFAVVLIVFAMVYTFVSKGDNREYTILISDVGIKFDQRIIPYTGIKTFWMEYDPPYFQTLHLVLKGDFTEDISINFHGHNPSEIRQILTNFLPEWEERKLSITEQIIRFFGL